MRRTTLATIAAMLALAVPAALAGCAGNQPDDQPSKAPLGIASSGVALPSAARPAGPPITAACPLLSATAVASTFGVPSATATENQGGSGKDGTSYICRYQFGNTGNNWMMLIVSVGPVTGTPQQAVEHSLQRYTGTLEPVPGLADAARYNGSDTYADVDAARIEGTEMRQVLLTTFVRGLPGNPKDKVIALARAVLERV